MGGLKTAFIHNGIQQQSSFIPRCLEDCKSWRTDKERKEGGGYRTERTGYAGRTKAYTCFKKSIYHKKYSPDLLSWVLPIKLWRAHMSPLTLLVLLESWNGLEMSEQTFLSLSYFYSLPVPTSFYREDFQGPVKKNERYMKKWGGTERI